MNSINIRAITTGVVAGIVTVTGIIMWDEHDPWGRTREVIARRRLTPAERAEFDRLKNAKAAQRAVDARHRDERTAQTRAKFEPGLLGGKHPVGRLEELTAPQLIAAIEQADTETRNFYENRCGAYGDLTLGSDVHRAMQRWSGHRAALLNEFHRRRGWAVRRQLPRLDQLRMDTAEKRVNALEFEPMPAPARPIVTRVYPPYPDFAGPTEAGHGTTTETEI